ncbi:MAG: cytosine permease [Pseudonocardia sp.]|nr:cytosine permease [Pseudonocardia sp.]MBO0871917.1 cytosine permease [Pseudonocardia sp.]
MSVEGIERRSIDVIPDVERHGSPRNQLTLWFGANMQITAIVDGALAVAFGADALWAMVGLLIGNMAGGAVMALHSAQGPRLGLPQMISSRAQFGVYGAVVPLLMVVLMYLGFAATGTVLGGQAIVGIVGGHTPAVGIVAFGVLTAVVATLGYRYIHMMGRVATVVGILGFAYLAVRLFVGYDVGSMLGAKPFEAPTFLLAVALGAGWQLTYGPYVADYSRYLPRDTPKRATFHGTFWGSVLGSQWSMCFGVLMAAIPASAGGTFLDEQVPFLGRLGGGGAIAVAIYLVIIIGKLTVNCLNAYGGFMSLLTTVTAMTGRRRISKGGRAAFIGLFILAAVLIAVLSTKHFLTNFQNFVLVLLIVFTPWSAVNLVDYYLVSAERVDVPALYDPDGRYGRWNGPALVSYTIGILAQIPFMAQTLYTGPLTELLGGADISWLVGLVVTAAVYYPWARRTANPPAEMIYHESEAEATARQPETELR